MGQSHQCLPCLLFQQSLAGSRPARGSTNSLREELLRNLILDCEDDADRIDLLRLRLWRDPRRDLRKLYHSETYEVIGKGGFGVVYKSRHRASGRECAVKRIGKACVLDIQLACKELQALLELDHPNVIRLHEWFEDALSVYLVTELASGGDLTSRFPCDGVEAARVFRQLMSAVRYCHDRGLAHRDLKPENCLLTAGPEPDQCVKVIDFGLAAMRQPGDMHGRWLRETVGTLAYMAPEVVERRAHGVKCDIWSTGVILCQLLTGLHPFAGRECAGCEGVAVLCQPCRFRLMDMLDRVDPTARALVDRMLTEDPWTRPGAAQVQQHPWLARRPQGPQEARLLRSVLLRVHGYASRFCEMTRFQRAMASATAYQLLDHEQAELRRAFAVLDSEGCGSLSREALGQAFAECGLEMSDDQLASLSCTIDGNLSGRVSYTEWLTAALRPDFISSEDSVKAAFGFFDADGDGQISGARLLNLLGEDSVDLAMKRWGRKGDGKLTLECFRSAMRRLAADSAARGAAGGA